MLAVGRFISNETENKDMLKKYKKKDRTFISNLFQSRSKKDEFIMFDKIK